MITTKLSDDERARVSQRTGHGAASVIPRLNEQMAHPESPALDEPTPAVPASEAPVATDPDKVAP